MSRLVKYRESLVRFIKDKSILLNNNSVGDPNFEPFLYSKIKNDDLLLSIVFLTIMNSQNKKNKITLQGYYAASSIEMLNIIVDISENSEKYNKDFYYRIINFLTTCSFKSFYQNLESIKSFVDQNLSSSVFFDSMDVFTNNVFESKFSEEFAWKITEDGPNKDLIKWYLKNNEECKDNFNNLKMVKKECFEDFINNKIGALSEIAFSISWIMGCGSIKLLPKIKKMSKNFAWMYKIALDFDNIEDDLSTDGLNFSKNYVVNYGLQESYEKFMDNKQKMIEELMVLEIYTITIKEIMNYIEEKVDRIIDETSPDLKSNFSNISNILSV